MSLAFIRKNYGVPAKRGGRIILDWPPSEARTGTITGSWQHVLRVRFDGENRTAFVHPAWNVVYLDSKEKP